MTVEHKWTVSSLEVEKLKEGLEDVVITVHWRLRATDDEDGLSVETYGATGLESPDADSFTTFDSITEEQMLSWLEAALPVDSLKENLANQLAEKRAPKVVSKVAPWVAAASAAAAQAVAVEEQPAVPVDEPPPEPVLEE